MPILADWLTVHSYEEGKYKIQRKTNIHGHCYRVLRNGAEWLDHSYSKFHDWLFDDLVALHSLKTKNEAETLLKDHTENMLADVLREGLSNVPVKFKCDTVPYSHGGTCVYVMRAPEYKTNEGAFFVDNVEEGLAIARRLNAALTGVIEVPVFSASAQSTDSTIQVLEQALGQIEGDPVLEDMSCATAELIRQHLVKLRTMMVPTITEKVSSKTVEICYWDTGDWCFKKDIEDHINHMGGLTGYHTTVVPIYFDNDEILKLILSYVQHVI